MRDRDPAALQDERDAAAYGRERPSMREPDPGALPGEERGAGHAWEERAEARDAARGRSWAADASERLAEREPSPRAPSARPVRSPSSAAPAVERLRLSRGSDAPRRSGTGRPKPTIDFDPQADARATRGRLGLWVFVLSTAGAVALLLAYFALGRDRSRDALGFLRPTAPTHAVGPEPQTPTPRAYGDLRVNSQPDRAQVLLLIGPGPALATDIPLGVAQEFVALAEQHRAARALLPSDAVWDEVDGQPRYELAIQARPLSSKRRRRHHADALGPTLLPQAVGAPTGRLGSVRVVTTPRAAQVYQLIGFTPDVHVDNLPLDHAYELLVYVEGRAPVRHHVQPSDFQLQDGKRIAVVDVNLPEP